VECMLAWRAGHPVSEAKTLSLTETGIARDESEGEAVNVGPILAALRFLTEGRGDDRGIDADGAPLPDLLSLAFDVVRSIILGGVDAEFFREVKRQFDARAAGHGASLGLAKRATLARSAPLTAVKRASAELRTRLRRLDDAATQLDLELEALQGGKPPRREVTNKKASRKAANEASRDAARKRPKKVAQIRHKAAEKKAVRQARQTRRT
jgi:hypothetical protein